MICWFLLFCCFRWGVKKMDTLRSGWTALTVRKCEIFIFSFHWSLILWHSNTFYLTLGGSKMHFSCPLHLHCFRNIYPLWERLVLFQKYPLTMRAACAISEISSTMRGLCYFRNNHPLWKWLALFQKYPPTMRWTAVRGGIGDSSSCMKIDFFLCKIRFRTHRIII